MKTAHLTSQEVGIRLRETRKLRGLSVPDISERLRIPQSTVRNVEAGEIEKHYPEIYAMTCIYVKPLHELFDGFFNFERIPPYFLRDKTDTENEKIRQYVLDCIEFHRRLQSRSVHLSGVPVDKNSRTVKKSLVPAVLEARAQDVIKKHNLYKLPINVYQIATNLDIYVTFESLPSNLFELRGFCYKEEKFNLIAINKSHPIELQRFTMAHELHHLLYDTNSLPFSCGSYNEEEVIENNAERFAAELLMPKDSIQRLISYPPNINYLTIHLVAGHFKVSYQAAAIRLQKFGLIDSSATACKSSYRKKDKEKTNFLLKNKLKYLKAVFGLETGIKELQIDSEVQMHSLCGSPVFDSSQEVCWYCGIQIRKPSSKNFLLQNPYRQSMSNLSPDKVLSVEKKKDYTQLSLNLKTN